MKRSLAILTLSAFALLAFASPASATAHKAVVNIPSCYTFDAQSETIPAGLKLVLQTGWITKTLAQESDFLAATKMKVTVNGVALTGIRSHWGDPYFVAPGNKWQMTWAYPLTVIGTGQQKAVVMSLTFTRQITDGFTTYPKGTTNYDCVINGA